MTTTIYLEPHAEKQAPEKQDAKKQKQDADDQAERDFNPRTVIPRHIRPIVDAPHIAAEKAGPKVVNDNDLVLGVLVGDEARAYPINMLCGPRREIINDVLGGEAIAATW